MPLVFLDLNTVNSEIFARILFSRITLKHDCGVKNWGLEHDLPTSVHDRVISTFRENLIFTKLRI